MSTDEEILAEGTSRLSLSENIQQELKQIEAAKTEQELAAALAKLHKPSKTQAILTEPIIPKLIDILSASENSEIIVEALWILKKYSLQPGTASKLLASGALPALLRHLSSNNEITRNRALRCLGNVADEGAEFRDLILQSKVLVAHLQQRIPSTAKSVREHAFCIYRLSSGDPSPKSQLVEPFIPVLSALLYSADEHVLEFSLAALNNIAKKLQEQVVQANILRRTIELLKHKNEDVIESALKLVDTLSSASNDMIRQIVINYDALPLLKGLLSHTKQEVRIGSCCVLAALSSGNAEQVNTLIKSGVYPLLIALAESEEPSELKKQALLALCHAQSRHTFKYMTEQGVAQLLGRSLGFPDNALLVAILDAIHSLLQEGARQEPNVIVHLLKETEDFWDNLEALQSNNDEEVKGRIIPMLEEYFNEEEE